MCKSHWAETWPCSRLAWMQLTNTKFIQFSLAKNIRFFCLQMLKFRCLSKLIKDKGTTLEKITANPKVILEFKLNQKPKHWVVRGAQEQSTFFDYGTFHCCLWTSLFYLGFRQKHRKKTPSICSIGVGGPAGSIRYRQGILQFQEVWRNVWPKSQSVEARTVMGACLNCFGLEVCLKML